MDQELSRIIDGMEPAYAAMLTRWIQVPSVKGRAEDGAPFGAEVRRMLDMALQDASDMGFDTRNFDGYAGDATLGDGDESIAVLAHLDVVPAGDGWQTPPFGAVREGKRIYGRGTSDDKGPALAAMFAMKAIRDAKIPLKKSIRLILGCDEESGWEDMAYYTAHADMPAMGFSPDATYPVINTEKGLLHLSLRGKTAPEGVQVIRWQTGERPNVIPGAAEMLLRDEPGLSDRITAYVQKTGAAISTAVSPEGLTVRAIGIPGHAAFPSGGRNAIGMLLCLLRELGVAGSLGTLAQAVGLEYDGASLGCAVQDRLSGPLTCNMGIIRVEDGDIYATLDLRCPVMASLDTIIATIEAHLPGFTVTVNEKKEAHHVPENSELVQCLLDAYHEETGRERKAIAIGGGTYARVLKEGVAFGATFPEDPDLAHQAGEYMDLDVLMQNVRIFANALIRLAGE